jgi:hypothetical protein
MIFSANVIKKYAATNNLGNGVILKRNAVVNSIMKTRAVARLNFAIIEI